MTTEEVNHVRLQLSKFTEYCLELSQSYDNPHVARFLLFGLEEFLQECSKSPGDRISYSLDRFDISLWEDSRKCLGFKKTCQNHIPV